jgi:hypothetical protein
LDINSSSTHVVLQGLADTLRFPIHYRHPRKAAKSLFSA